MGNLWPSYLAFLLSFGTILIIWVNHHYTVRLLHGICKSFLYANGFLLLTITVFPFPTAILAEYINTKFATTGIVLYSLACLLINFCFYLFATLLSFWFPIFGIIVIIAINILWIAM